MKNTDQTNHSTTSKRKRRDIINSSIAISALKLSSKIIWSAPIVSTILLPAHASTTTQVEPEQTDTSDDQITDPQANCPTETSSDVIVTAGDFQRYDEGQGTGIWWSTIGPVPAGHVAFNLLPTVNGTNGSDVIFWEVSFDNGASFTDVSAFGITNGQTVIDQETSGNAGSTPAVPDTENQTGLIFRVNIKREECMDDILRSVTFNIVATNLYVAPGGGAPIRQFAQSWQISYTSLDANLNPMGSPVNLPSITA